MAIIILRDPRVMAERKRQSAENRARARDERVGEGSVLLVIRETCVCGCGELVPQEGRDGMSRFFVNEGHYLILRERTQAKTDAMLRDGLVI